MKKFNMLSLGCQSSAGLDIFCMRSPSRKASGSRQNIKSLRTRSTRANTQPMSRIARESIRSFMTGKRRWPLYSSMRKPGETIIYLETLIGSMNRPQYVQGRQATWNSGQVRLVAKYYSILSEAYGMKHDVKKQAWALNMSMHYEAEAEQLRKRG